MPPPLSYQMVMDLFVISCMYVILPLGVSAGPHGIQSQVQKGVIEKDNGRHG